MDARRNRLRRIRTRGVALAVYAVLCFAPAGCTGFWDEVWSRDFSIKEWWTPPDPLVVLQKSTDGDRRARALAALKEPKQYGGSDHDQDVIVEILITAATTERVALCRLKAIEAMQTFKDPRMVGGLEKAYDRASSFPAETASIIRCRALEALGMTRHPDAVPVLVRVLKAPPVAAEASEAEKQQAIDERTAAARALGHFRGLPAAQALVAVLRTEQDIALRNRAHESLVASTGQNLGPDAKVWADYLANAGKDMPTGVVEEPGVFHKMYDMILPVDYRK
jgi:hypothetical protein